MSIAVKVIAHSRVDVGTPDLITLQMRYPRFIHAEAKTHRLIRIDDAEYEFLQEISFMDDENLSRNASSSRAVPVERMIQDVIEDPAMPVRWGANQPGMQDAGDHKVEVLVPHIILDDGGPERGDAWLSETDPVDAWRRARDIAVEYARGFAKAGYHKQVVNRLLEPFAHISVVVTATEWDNFFALRCHPDADPTMRALAEAMRDAIESSVPTSSVGDWHLPYVSEDDRHSFRVNRDEKKQWILAMISAARCARVSYLNHDGTNPDIDKDLALAQRLLESKHASPFEHQACPDIHNHYFGWDKAELHGNLVGWKQFRKMLEKQ